MEQQQTFSLSPLMTELEQKLPKMNFYRFCQLLEQISGDCASIGIAESPALDPIRFAPAPEMSFPAGELKCIERGGYLNRPATVRTRFLGLYGVDSILPPALLENIIAKEEGYQATTDFLDIFNHRIITQFYRIWLKYHYPASYISGGQDAISRCLLGLTGLGIKGSSEQIGTPSSRFLALLGLVTQRTRTAEGIAGVIKVLVPNTDVKVQEFFPIWVNIDEPAKFGQKGVELNGCAVLGSRFRESNQTVRISIIPHDSELIESLLPGGQMHTDIMALIRLYLGYRVDAQFDLHILKQFLPATQLLTSRSRLGQTASLIKRQRVEISYQQAAKQDSQTDQKQEQNYVVVNLGRYQGIAA